MRKPKETRVKAIGVKMHANLPTLPMLTDFKAMKVGESVWFVDCGKQVEGLFIDARGSAKARVMLMAVYKREEYSPPQKT